MAPARKQPVRGADGFAGVGKSCRQIRRLARADRPEPGPAFGRLSRARRGTDAWSDGPELDSGREVCLAKAHVPSDFDESYAPCLDEAAHHALIHGKDFSSLTDGQEYLESCRGHVSPRVRSREG